MKNQFMLGVHCSTAGGVDNAFREVDMHDIDVFQIFTKNQKQWREPELKPEVVTNFHEKSKASGVQYKFSHASYLLNLAGEDEELWLKSTRAMIAEVERCHLLGLDATVFHPGYAKELSEKEAIKRIAAALKIIFSRTKDTGVMILLENTAGQGTSIGGKFEHLKMIIELTASERLGICIDTCHAFVAGHDIRTHSGMEDFIAQLDKLVGLKHLRALHLNDSKGLLGSRLDRHEHIGQGQIGLEAFRYIMNHFRHVPKVIETPKAKNMDAVNLKVLRELAI